MARIALHVEHLPNRMTLKAMLEAEGHQITDAEPDCVIADTPARALGFMHAAPTLVLASASGIADAVQAMRQGVYGYIFVPLQPGEASLMVRRALQDNAMAAMRPAETPQEKLSLAEAELRYILDTLRRCKYNQARAARLLGIGRNTLWRKLKQAQRKEEGKEDNTLDKEHPDG